MPAPLQSTCLNSKFLFIPSMEMEGMEIASYHLQVSTAKLNLVWDIIQSPGTCSVTSVLFSESGEEAYGGHAAPERKRPPRLNIQLHLVDFVHEACAQQ